MANPWDRGAVAANLCIDVSEVSGVGKMTVAGPSNQILLPFVGKLTTAVFSNIPANEEWCTWALLGLNNTSLIEMSVGPVGGPFDCVYQINSGGTDINGNPVWNATTFLMCIRNTVTNAARWKFQIAGTEAPFGGDKKQVVDPASIRVPRLPVPGFTYFDRIFSSTPCLFGGKVVSFRLKLKGATGNPCNVCPVIAEF